MSADTTAQEWEGSAFPTSLQQQKSTSSTPNHEPRYAVDTTAFL